MNVDNNTQTMLFEQLPTELFLQIFSFLQFQETITAFSNLNSYLNSVIQNINDGFFQVSYDDVEAVHLLNVYLHQIGRLTVIHSPSVNFTTSVNLRSLTIKFGTIAQLNAIRPQNLPMLEILHICGVNGSSEQDKTKTVNELFDTILSNDFPHLRICTAAGIGLLQPNDNWTGSSTIQLLILDEQIPIINETISALCPNLRQPKSVINIPFDLRMNSTMPESYPKPHYKRILKDIMQMPQLETERKFIIDECSTATVIQGRILPRSEPYCFASFRFKIEIPPEYPFKPPNGYFLDPIYHPMIQTHGKYCCCHQFFEEWAPYTRLTDYITRVIDIIDNSLQVNYRHCPYHKEHKTYYIDFQEKALRNIFQYGQPRF